MQEDREPALIETQIEARAIGIDSVLARAQLPVGAARGLDVYAERATDQIRDDPLLPSRVQAELGVGAEREPARVREVDFSAARFGAHVAAPLLEAGHAARNPHFV